MIHYIRIKPIYSSSAETKFLKDVDYRTSNKTFFTLVSHYEGRQLSRARSRGLDRYGLGRVLE